jgi:aldehyde:ferredoxin oxidoreductase
VPDVELLLKEYYALRGLDERGYPKKAMLTELGLDELKNRLYT